MKLTQIMKTLILAFLSVLMINLSVSAATITVKSNADAGGTCPGATCTLRQAIATAADGDTINFDMTSMTSPITLASTLTINKNLTIQGPGANQLTISGNNAVTVFNISSGNLNVTLSGLTIASGGGIDTGNGIYNNSTGTLTITGCTISGNNGGQGSGVENSDSGTVNITNSTISGNSDTSSYFDKAGGIANFSTGTVNITNSTISGNSASNTQYGNPAVGGIYNFSTGIVNITSSTISGNSASGSGSSYNDIGGGIVNKGGGTVNVKNTIIAGNTSQVATGQDVTGTFTSQGFNLIGKADGSTGFTNGTNSDQVGTNAAPIDPILGPLADNGGSTQTMALLTGSPAIDKGKSFGLMTDQRYAPRPVDLPSIPNASLGDGADIGAFEVQQNTPPDHLAFVVQPTTTAAGAVIAPPSKCRFVMHRIF